MKTSTAGPDTEQPAYLRSFEVCEQLGIDRSTLSRWVATGRIEPAMKLPGLRGAFLFHPAHVAALLPDRTADSA
jgi:excisionase family DNA binding protein